ncbi:MAG: gamma-glutamylcyclotransferase family protein [Acidimicrobiales bacterium]|nr:gamma-glutamylcyclotransferase family protein [Acidimicrobiales bacterium]
MTEPTEHLATYGTLMPGEENHWVVRGIAGTWTNGTVAGWTYPIGFGPAEGYPGFTADPAGPAVEVAVLTCEAGRLAKHWREIDEFEGPGYRRMEIDVVMEGGETARAWIYETDPEAE